MFCDQYSYSWTSLHNLHWWTTHPPWQSDVFWNTQAARHSCHELDSLLATPAFYEANKELADLAKGLDRRDGVKCRLPHKWLHLKHDWWCLAFPHPALLTWRMTRHRQWEDWCWMRRLVRAQYVVLEVPRCGSVFPVRYTSYLQDIVVGASFWNRSYQWQNICRPETHFCCLIAFCLRNCTQCAYPLTCNCLHQLQGMCIKAG